MSNFCRDCQHYRGFLPILPECEASRKPRLDYVTGKTERGHRYTCSGHRAGRITCPDFAPKPTIIERIKELFA